MFLRKIICLGLLVASTAPHKVQADGEIPVLLGGVAALTGAAAVGYYGYQHYTDNAQKRAEDKCAQHANAASALEYAYTEYVTHKAGCSMQEAAMLLNSLQMLPNPQNFDAIEQDCFARSGNASARKALAYANFLDTSIVRCNGQLDKIQGLFSDISCYLNRLKAIAAVVPSEVKKQILANYYHFEQSFEEYYKCVAPLNLENVGRLTQLRNDLNSYMHMLRERRDILAQIRLVIEHTPLYQREHAEQVHEDLKLKKSNAIRILQLQIADLRNDKDRLQRDNDKLCSQKHQLKRQLSSIETRYMELRIAFERCGGRRDAQYRRVDDLLFAQDVERFLKWLFD